MPLCNKCGEDREFYPSIRNYCKSCHTFVSKEWIEKNKEKNRIRKLEWQRRPEQKEKRRLRHIKDSYNLMPADFQTMLDKQGSKCAICFTGVDNRPNNNTHVDHDHSNGRVRGILCRSCNMGIGFLKHDKDILHQAIDYLSM